MKLSEIYTIHATFTDFLVCLYMCCLGVSHRGHVYLTCSGSLAECVDFGQIIVMLSWSCNSSNRCNHVARFSLQPRCMFSRQPLVRYSVRSSLDLGLGVCVRLLWAGARSFLLFNQKTDLLVLQEQYSCDTSTNMLVSQE